MNFILWVVFGGIAGWLASLVMNTDAEQGALMNIIVGVVGAVLGGFLMNLFGQSGVNGFNLYSFVVAIIGAVVLLWIYKAVSRRY
jgi:uncharacterized membrane protein YeaQ/YmgE (transglycosylase-associated protein family)